MNKIAEFVDSFVPENLPRKRADSLKDELTCHILDKRDYYMQIGYDEDASVDKAIADFGTDEVCKNYIYNEFEELYSERNIYGIIAFLVIAVMNFLCFPLDVWIWSADSNYQDPEPSKAMTSFVMILIVFAMIAFARIDKHRKTLISIGVANTLVAGSMLFAFYPQIAAYTICNNVIYLVDRFTPFSMYDTILGGDIGGSVLSWLILLLPAIYCFVEAFRIKRGTAKAVGHPRKKLIIFGAAFLAVSVISSLLFTTSQAYIDGYPIPLDCYKSGITYESSKRFDEITVGDSYAAVSERLRSNGYVPIEEYRDSLDKLPKKQFNAVLKDFDFANGYEIWFAPEKDAEGNGFVGLKQEKGVVTAKGIGNMEEDMYTERTYNNHSFGYTDWLENFDIPAVDEYFKNLRKGDSENEIIDKFSKEFGVVYTKRISVQSDETESYYRIYCIGARYPDNEIKERYLELTFKNGKLSEGIMYHTVDLSADNPVETLTVG